MPESGDTPRAASPNADVFPLLCCCFQACPNSFSCHVHHEALPVSLWGSWSMLTTSWGAICWRDQVTSASGEGVAGTQHDQRLHFFAAVGDDAGLVKSFPRAAAQLGLITNARTLST